MRDAFFLRRLLILFALITIFGVCSMVIGISNAIKVTLLISIPGSIMIIGAYYIGRYHNASRYLNLMIAGLISVTFFIFSLLGMVFDPKNSSHLGFNIIIFPIEIGLSIFAICFIIATVLSRIKK
jgi:hypothetical protein